jgi:hypothetical protein
MSSVKTILIAFLLVLLSGGGLFYLIWYQKGFLEVSSSEPQFSIIITDYGQFNCELTSCRWRIKPGEYELVAKSDGYYDLNEEFSIETKKTTAVNIDFKPIPALTLLDNVPEGLTVAEARVPPVGNNPYSFNQAGEVYYYQIQTGEVYRGVGETRELLARIELEREPLLFANENLVYLVTQDNLYVVDQSKGVKFLLLEGQLKEVALSDSGLLVLSQEKLLLVQDDLQIVEFPLLTDPDLICYLSDNFYAVVNNQKQSEFWQISQNLEEIDLIASAQVQEFAQLKCRDQNSLLLLDAQENAWEFKF